MHKLEDILHVVVGAHLTTGLDQQAMNILVNGYQDLNPVPYFEPFMENLTKSLNAGGFVFEDGLENYLRERVSSIKSLGDVAQLIYDRQFGKDSSQCNLPKTLSFAHSPSIGIVSRDNQDGIIDTKFDQVTTTYELSGLVFSTHIKVLSRRGRDVELEMLRFNIHRKLCPTIARELITDLCKALEEKGYSDVESKLDSNMPQETLRDIIRMFLPTARKVTNWSECLQKHCPEMIDPPHRPQLVRVGDVVEVKDSSSFVLSCGSGKYGTAIVISLNPFVLVSMLGDMRWENTIKITDFVTVRKATGGEMARAQFRIGG